MLRNVKDLFGYTVRATDGDIGKVHDLYFDDEQWTVRYFVVDTGGFLSTHKVLISPEAVSEPDWNSSTIPVALTKERVEDSPGVDADKPIFRQEEEAFRAYYGWAPYWGTGFMAPVAPIFYPTIVPQPVPAGAQAEGDRESYLQQERQKGDPHLRSAREVIGYHIRATDDEIGHVEDFVLDTESAAIRYMIVDTKNWLPGKKTIVPPSWIDEIDYGAGKVRVSVTQDKVKEAPEFDASAPVNRGYEERLYDYYGRPVYWE